ncbi:TetR/AcrR family transcriptional regulator [Pseudonocardia spinosispora]|uniref:TetR/AcrR family transcriptional regulator n=1 Tax=Pseudonocardia spinosispora TaxID=103441 RepID=UPI0004232263|nr:TetR/AcrR family transcriptional regulator [Pseudonocardia spinosispora]
MVDDQQDSRRSPLKRRQILDAAVEVFCALGYARTSVDSIAAAAGVGKQTIYGHFGDKERLFLAAVDDARAYFPKGGGNLVPDTGDPRADLQAAGEEILNVVLSPKVSALHRLTIAELPHHPELQRAWREGSEPVLDNVIAAYLQRCHRAGLLDVPDAGRAARQFTYLMITEARVATAYGAHQLAGPLLRSIAASAADLIVRAYRPLASDEDASAPRE